MVAEIVEAARGQAVDFLRAVRTARSSVQGDDARPLIDDDRLSFQRATAADSRRASSCGMDTGVRDVSDFSGSPGTGSPGRRRAGSRRRIPAERLPRPSSGGAVADWRLTSRT